MIRVVHILSSLNGGGVENMLLNYYQGFDRDEIKFDFIVHGYEEGILEHYFTSLGCNIYHVNPKKKGFIKNSREIYNILKRQKFDIIHCHQGPKGYMSILISRILGYKTIINHNHIAFVPESRVSYILRRIMGAVSNVLSTHYFACGKDAAIWAFGKKKLNNNKISIINNAIDIEKFEYNPEIRKLIREELEVGTQKVIGSIGRFTFQKNHKFLIDIFYKLLELKPDLILWLVGEGPLKSEINEYVKVLGITDKVKFLGVRDDVQNLLQGMDLFLLPTRFEGLGIVYIEAQAAGLRTIASKRVVPIETKVTSLIEYIDIDDSIDLWAEEALKALGNYPRQSQYQSITSNNFNIKEERQKLEYLYKKISKGWV